MVILQKKISGLSEAALERFAQRARNATHLKGTVNILVTSSAAVQALNRRFRGKNTATDVLSFPSGLSASNTPSKLEGDLAISADVARQNAQIMGHSLAEEVKILMLHGILHLAGFDHERDHGTMARKELQLRRALNLPLGLIERAGPAAKTINPGPNRKQRSEARKARA